jgi:hypothetical protein
MWNCVNCNLSVSGGAAVRCDTMCVMWHGAVLQYDVIVCGLLIAGH